MIYRPSCENVICVQLNQVMLLLSHGCCVISLKTPIQCSKFFVGIFFIIIKEMKIKNKVETELW